MQQKSSSKTSIIILVCILVLGGIVYFYMSGTPTDDQSLVEEQGMASPATEIGAQVLTLLNQISSLKIDGSFFKGAVYSSLVDHTVPIYEQNVGKDNPFVDPRPRPAAQR